MVFLVSVASSAAAVHLRGIRALHVLNLDHLLAALAVTIDTVLGLPLAELLLLLLAIHRNSGLSPIVRIHAPAAHHVLVGVDDTVIRNEGLDSPSNGSTTWLEVCMLVFV